MDEPRPGSAQTNVFRSMQEFFDPAGHPPTPLVRLPAALVPFPPEERVQVFAKLMFLSPTLNLKWSPAFEMLRQGAGPDGYGGARLVEASSGNMALALALQSRAFGLAGVSAIVPADLAFVKKELLHLLGVELIISTEAGGEPSAIEKARARGAEPGFRNLAQYENPANPAAHARWTAAQVQDQTGGALSVFCAGLGTTGTLVGAREALAGRVQLVGARCAPGHAVPGVRSEARLAEIRFPWHEGIHPVEVTTKDSFRASLKLIRHGLLAGPSSGLALAGLLDFLAQRRQDPEAWAALRNPAGDIVAAFVCGDTPHLYVDKYSTHLDPADFAV